MEANFDSHRNDIQPASRRAGDREVAVRGSNGANHSQFAKTRRGHLQVRGEEFARRGREQHSIVR